MNNATQTAQTDDAPKSGVKPEFEKQVLQAVRSEGGMAKDIRKRLAVPGLTKKDVNRVLYRYEKKGVVTRDNDFGWEWTGDADMDLDLLVGLANVSESQAA